MKLLLRSAPASDDDPPPSPSLDMQSPLPWSDCAIPSPNFRISTYSALAGALVEKPTMTHAVQEHAADGCHECCEPPELAMYTVGVFDNDAVTPVDESNHVEQIDGWTESPAESFWPEPPSHMSPPRHHLGYGLKLYYDYTPDRDPEGSSIHAEHSYVPMTMPAASSEDSVRLYRITEYGQLHYASLSPPSPCSSEQSSASADADLIVDERASVSVKCESDTSSLYSPPESPLELEEHFCEYERKSPSPPRKRLRPTTLLACYYCRKRKIRCGGPDPSDEFKRCKQCIHRNRECEFPEKSNRGRRPKALPLPAPMDVDQYPHE